MKHLCLIIFLLVFSSELVFSQQRKIIDSLQKVNSKLKNEEKKIDNLNKLCRIYFAINVDSAGIFAKEAYDLSKKINYKKGEGNGLVHLFVTQFYLGNYDSTEVLVNQAIPILKEIKDYTGIINCYNILGNVNNSKGNPEKSLYYYDKILNIIKEEKIENPDFGFSALNNIGLVYSNKGENKKAIEYYLKALEIAEKNNLKKRISIISNNVGTIFTNLGEYEKGLNYHFKALKAAKELGNNIDIAFSYFDISQNYREQKEWEKVLEFGLKAEKIYDSLGHQNHKSPLLLAIAHAYGYLEQNDMAEKYYKKAIDLSQKQNEKSSEAQAFADLGKYYIINKKYKNAIISLKKSELICKETDAKNILAGVYGKQSLAYSSIRDYKSAFYAQNKFIELRDSLYNIKKNKQIYELETKYNNEKTNNENLKLKQDKELNEIEIQKQKRTKYTFMIGFILASLLIFVLVKYYTDKIKSNKLIALKNQEINQQKIADLEKIQKINALDAMITGQEAERKRIAKDLHDGLGALLSSVKSHFSTIQDQIEKLSELDVYGKTDQLIDEACREVRKIAHNMMPETLTNDGLEPALKDLCHKMTTEGKLEIDFQNVDFKQRLAPASEVMIYRIVQELLNNIVKHANAKTVMVQMLAQENTLNISVEDDGKGFELKPALAKESMGLKNLYSRTEYLNGKLNIDSVLGKGTSIILEIPIILNN